MTPTQTVAMLAQARALFPGMTLVTGQAELWHEALADLDYDDVRDALLRYAKRESRIVTVADLRSGVRARREDTLARRQAVRARVRTTTPPAEWYEARAAIARRAAERDEERRRAAALAASLDEEPDPRHDRYR